MALRFCDSFDHYTTVLQKWTGNSNSIIQAAAARTGGYGLQMSAGATCTTTRTLDDQGQWIVGVAYRIAAIAATDILKTLDSGAEQGVVSLAGTGLLRVQRGGVIVATSVRSLIANVWYYIEFKHIINNVGGTLEVRVNGELWVTFNGDTQATGNAFANQIQLYRTTGVGTAQYDDLYILDGVDQSIADPNSPPNNDYWGDTQVEALVPTGAGAYTELATLFGAPTHWQAEDEIPPDEDTSYVEDSVVDRRDTYGLTNLSVVSATIPGIQILTRARKTAAGAANFARLYRNAAADDQGGDLALSESYMYFREILGGDPIAAGLWTVANINSMEMGFRVR